MPLLINRLGTLGCSEVPSARHPYLLVLGEVDRHVCYN